MSTQFTLAALQAELDILERRAASIDATYRSLAGNRATRRAKGGAQREAQADAWRAAAKQQLAGQFKAVRERLPAAEFAVRAELEAANV